MSSLTEVSLPDLERLAHALERVETGAVLSREGLARAQLDALVAHLGDLLGRDVATARAVLHAVIAERRRPPRDEGLARVDGPRDAIERSAGHRRGGA